MADVFSSLPILILMPFLATIFILMTKKDQTQNIYNVCLLAIIANILIVWRFFYLIDPEINELQLISRFEWLKYLDISFMFGADVFSLILILAVHFAFLMILTCINSKINHPKTIASFAMLFLSLISGLLISADLFSFYLFFEAMLLPLFFIIGVGGGLKKQEKIYSFFLYNIFSSILFFVAIIMIFNINKNAYILENAHQIKLVGAKNYFIWAAILVSLLSRLPLWPFHRMLSWISSDIKNPLVFLISNLMPLTAIFGFVRIFSIHIEGNMQVVFFVLQIVAVVSMCFIALISFVHKDFQYKMFSYISIIYLFYLVASLYHNSVATINISLSFFGFIIAIAGIEILLQKYYLAMESFSKKRYVIFCGLIFSLIGAPLSSIFLNHFSILSIMYKNNPISTYFIFASTIIAGGALLSQIPKMKITSDKQNIPKTLIFICFILLMSFIKPLWFVEL